MTKLQRMMTSGLKQLIGEWKTIKFDIFCAWKPYFKTTALSYHCEETNIFKIYSPFVFSATTIRRLHTKSTYRVRATFCQESLTPAIVTIYP